MSNAALAKYAPGPLQHLAGTQPLIPHDEGTGQGGTVGAVTIANDFENAHGARLSRELGRSPHGPARNRYDSR